MNKLIYALEDDEAIGELIKYTMETSGFKVVIAKTVEELYSAVDEQLPHIFLLDIMLSGSETGLDVIKKLKNNKTTKNIPVIFLTSKSTEIDKAYGLDIGADDYIAKPFGVLELIARVKAVIRRSDIHEKVDNQLVYKDLIINRENKQVSKNNQDIPLTFKEFELFIFLLENAGTVISRDTLLDQIWGIDFFGERRTVDVHIRALRHKLGDDAGEPKYVKTIRGYGYMVIK